MSFAVGSLVRARGREWVVLPDSDDDLSCCARSAAPTTRSPGVLVGSNRSTTATFALPDPDDLGDYRSARLLRDALRLGFRSSAGPFRSFGGLNFEPRPYQLVPLLMALQLDPVRLLIADDVGIGKTVEHPARSPPSCSPRATVQRMAVLCPPHLAEQWQAEMADKFHLDAELVLPSTAGRLERGCRVGESLFERHDITIVSTDFIKADRRRDDFLRTAPSWSSSTRPTRAPATATTRGGRHLRHELVSGLAADPARHLCWSPRRRTPARRGRSAACSPSSTRTSPTCPTTSAATRNRRDRERLARHLVQRRRGDMRTFLGRHPVPRAQRRREVAYSLVPPTADLFDRCPRLRPRDRPRHRRGRSTASGCAGGRRSPCCARWPPARPRPSTRSTNRAAPRRRRQPPRRPTTSAAGPCSTSATTTPKRTSTRRPTPASRTTRRRRRVASSTSCASSPRPISPARRHQARRPRRARRGPAARRLQPDRVLPLHPDRRLRRRPSSPGDCPRAEVRRRRRDGSPRRSAPAIVDELAPHDRRVLVATDCLCEGINLQALFDAVVHYDLSWNPTRHEQREGRVDRFGQPSRRSASSPTTARQP